MSSHFHNIAGRKKYCLTCNFLDRTCPFINNYGSCDVLNASFIVDEDDICNVKPEDILLFQTGEKNKFECGSKITKRSNMKTNFEEREIECEIELDDIANQLQEEKKNTSNVSFCDKYFGCGSCFCCNDNEQKQIINNTVNIDDSNSEEPIRNLRNLDNNTKNSANKYPKYSS